jgi:hypothetical protein
MLNRYKLNLNKLKSDYINFKIPIIQNEDWYGQAEILEKDFISVEVEKAINPIVDYEKYRFIPTNNNGDVDKISYYLNLLDDNGNLINHTTYDIEGFTYGDLRYNKNKFKRSFLRLMFFDSDDVTNQNFLFQTIIYCRLYDSDIIKPQQGVLSSALDSNKPKPLQQIPIRFIVGDSSKNSDLLSDGYYILYNKKDLPLDLFMRATWNNASNGKTKNLSTSNTKLEINEINKSLFMKFTLKEDNNKLYYLIDETYSNNITYSNNEYIIELYEVQVK